MDIKAQKDAVRIFEFAFQELERKANEGLYNLSRLKGPEKGVHLTDLNNNDALGANTLLASQTIPAIVVLSLAIEQALKVLIKQENEVPKHVHELKILFNQLPLFLQDEIKAFVTTDLTITEEAFEDHLLENNNAFVNWRYFYEKQDTGSLSFLKSFFDSLKTKIE
ncbi:hypothetical protein [Pontibacter pamirensis]|uniref:hypothetical protein n=1 Tax=Pontibacter pamirensis TaxID=2562824 RepID=UPI0013899C13|nr:hypothetical protein [Pontibacter pamirensis]